MKWLKVVLLMKWVKVSLQMLLYSSLDNQNFDHFLDLDDDEVVAKVTDVEPTLETNEVFDKGKQVVDSDHSQHDEDNDHSEIREDSDDGEDNDYIVDEVNEINEVKVDIENFHANVDVNVKFMGMRNGKKKHVTFEDPVDVKVLDNSEFESASDADDDLDEVRK